MRPRAGLAGAAVVLCVLSACATATPPAGTDTSAERGSVPCHGPYVADVDTSAAGEPTPGRAAALEMSAARGRDVQRFVSSAMLCSPRLLVGEHSTSANCTALASEQGKKDNAMCDLSVSTESLQLHPAF